MGDVVDIREYKNKINIIKKDNVQTFFIEGDPLSIFSLIVKIIEEEKGDKK